MQQGRETFIWILVGVTSILFLVWAFPKTFPFFLADWTIDRGEARSIALERFRDLGEPVEDPYLVIEFNTSVPVERRLQEAREAIDLESFRTSQLGRTLARWDVRVYAPGALPTDWTYRCLISRSGDVLALLKKGSKSSDDDSAPGDDERSPIDEDDVRQRAAEALERAGFDLEDFEPEPALQRIETDQEREVRLRYRWRERVLDERFAYGIEIRFSGDEFLGFTSWFEDPEPDVVQAFFRQAELIEIAHTFLPYLLLPFVIVPFLRRYHDGQLGVRRGIHFFLLFWSAGILFLMLCGRAVAANMNMGLPRDQTTWLVSLFILIFFFSSKSVLALMSWAVGESFCRRLWPQKLASIDAFFRGRWTNSTVALSALRGVAAGCLMAALSMLFGLALQDVDAWMMSGYLFSDDLTSVLPGISVVAAQISFHLPIYLLACFLIPCWLSTRLGPNRALIPACLLASLILSPFALAVPTHWGFLGWMVVASIPILLFRFGDLLSTLLAGTVAPALIGLYPLLVAEDPGLQSHGWAALLLVASPLILSARWLGTGDEFHYTYDDIPPHVRRIAERERQRVELETAAQIQTSILPRLPPQVNGLEIAHTYLPASEVGGDFYDVLALEDGRVALAVGDVAGHGVSSGLVMSMAKSALAVQVTFDPEVESVLHTLNRMVYQSARRRLLTTLCYAVVDPKLRELHYASAGHLYPYQVSSTGEVRALEDSSYPLGVRSQIEVRTHAAKLAPGDAIFLYSDGLVEATAENSDEPFGFDRLEKSLGRHASKPPAAMRDAILKDVEAFTGHNRNSDDVTILILRLPA